MRAFEGLHHLSNIKQTATQNIILFLQGGKKE